MFTEEKRYASLARLLRQFDYVIIDTCSLMDDAFPDWLNDFKETKKAYIDGTGQNFHVYVPYRCYEELKKHAGTKARTPDLIEKQIAARRALRVVQHAKFWRILEITKKDKTENYADNAITVQVIRDRLDHKILVITQDKGLASDLLYWNHSQSQKGKYLAVYKLCSDGSLAMNKGKANGPEREHNVPSKPQRKEPNPPSPAPKKAPQPKVEQPKPYDASSADRRLKAILGNPNYPLLKKKADVKAHLDGLATLSSEEVASLNLMLSEGALRRFLITGKLAPEEKKAPAKESAPAPTPAPAPEKKKLYIVSDRNLKDALDGCAHHFGVMFRYHSIPYNKQFHGKIDLTDLDLHAISSELEKLLTKQPAASMEFKGLKAYAEKTPSGYQACIDFDEALKANEPKPAEKPAKAEIIEPEKPSKPKKKKAKKDNTFVVVEEKKVAEPPIEEKAPEEKPAPKKEKKAKKPAEPKPAEKPEPKKAEQPKKSEPKKAKEPKKPEEPKKAPEVKKEPEPKKVEEPKKPEQPKKASKAKKPAEPAPMKEEAQPEPKPAKPAKKKAAKKQEKLAEEPKPIEPVIEEKKPEPKPAPKKEKKAKKEEEPKPAEPAKKPEPKKAPEVKKDPEPKKAKEPKKKEEPKKVPETKKEPSKVADPFEEAKSFEARLRANVNNSNYPLASKIKDLKAQLERIKKLKPEQRNQLAMSADTIKMMLSMLEASK